MNSNCNLCLCDFGLARGISSSLQLSAEKHVGKKNNASSPISCLTEYVVTRWYRAPELLCESNHYGKAADIWSVGCIFAELITRKPFFQGKTPLHQLEMIIEVLGDPNERDISFIRHSPVARDVIKYARLKADPNKRGLKRYFPSTIGHDAFDLVNKMLVVNPEER